MYEFENKSITNGRFVCAHTIYCASLFLKHIFASINYCSD